MNNDLHKQGVFAVVTPSGEVLFETFSQTGYSARAEFLRGKAGPWSKHEANGYTIAEFAKAGVVCSTPREEPIHSIYSKVIDTQAAAAQFLLKLHEQGRSFHPDDLAETIINAETGERIFTDAEARLVNVRIKEVFKYIDDPYSFIMDLDKLPEELRWDAAANTWGFEHSGMFITNVLISECGRFHVSPENYGFAVTNTGGGCTSHTREFLWKGKKVIMSVTDSDDGLMAVDEETVRANVTLFSPDWEEHFESWTLTREGS